MSLSRILAILCLLFLPVLSEPARGDVPRTGSRIMAESLRRQGLYLYVYEELTVILTDRAGNREVRKARRFSRIEEDGSKKSLLVFDTPPEIRGVALLAESSPSGPWKWSLYLPAFGKKLISYDGRAGGGRFLGTDFSVMDLIPEVLSDFRYARGSDQKINLVPCYVVEALPRDREVERATGCSLHRNFLRKDNFFLIRTDYFDRHGRFFKRRTFHDLKRVDGDMWHADMILMENTRERHMTIIKVDRRVLSRDYVPPEIFTPSWLLENRHIPSSERLPLREGSPFGQGPAGPAADGPERENR
ncbi:MAG: outer membrane lipoprotein-sorting protein [Deltaproteobacteria bacterium]|nr:outer membrane lipoprotein-sorting protein [Deltaproteobacteria bacterium]